MSDEIAQFVAERDGALLSMDEARIKTFMHKNGAAVPESDEVFWVAVHKARTGAMSLPENERRHSIQWLADRGYAHLADDLENAAATDKATGRPDG